MKFWHLHFFALLTSAASQATVHHDISSRGPDVTISLSWNPAHCPRGNSPVYRVELCSFGLNAEWLDFKEIRSSTVAKFESSEKFPISYFREYRVRIFLYCTHFEPWHHSWIRTGAGELRPLRGVTAIGGNRKGTITWLEPTENGDNVEIVVCQKTSKNCTEAFWSYSQSQKYIVERLSHGMPYTAVLSVSKEFMGKIYRSQPVSVDFVTLPREARNFPPITNFAVKVLKKEKDVDLILEYSKPVSPSGSELKGVRINVTDRFNRATVEPFESNSTEIRIKELPYLAHFIVYISALYEDYGDIEESEAVARAVLTGTEVLPDKPQIREAVSISNHSVLIRWSHNAHEFVELTYKITLDNGFSVEIQNSDIGHIIIDEGLEPRREYNATLLALLIYNGETITLASEEKRFQMLPEDALIAKPSVEEIAAASIRLVWEVMLPDGFQNCRIGARHCNVANACSTTTISDMTARSMRLDIDPFEHFNVTMKTTCFFAPDIIVSGVSETLNVPGASLPGPPSGVTILHVRGRKIVQWNAEIEPKLLIASYKVNATALPSLERTVLFTKIRQFEMSTLMSNTRFALRISACMDAAGSKCGEPAFLEASTMDIGYPSRPRVELVSQNGGHIVIRWTEPEEPFGPIDGYEIAYGWKGESFSPSNWVSVRSSERTKTFERLQAKNTYIFRVVAFNLDSRDRKLYSLPGTLEVTID